MADCNVSYINGPLGITATGPRTVIVPADPIIWNDQTSYEYLTLVASADFGKSYVSKKDVPAGTPLTDEDYWIPAADFNAQISNLQGSVDDLVTEFDNFKSDVTQTIDKVHTGFLGATINPDENTLDFVYTSDFENITRVKSIANPLSTLPASDYIYLKKINDYYYIFTNTGYAYTKDFGSFEVLQYGITWPDTHTLIWGITPIPESNYFICCHNYQDGTFVSKIGVSSYYFKVYIIPYTLDGAKINFGTPSPVNFTGFMDGTSSVIDIDVMYDGTYHVTLKDEVTDTIRVYNAETISDLISGNWVDANFKPVLYGVEAPKFVQVGNSYSIVASEYMYSGNIVACMSGDTVSASGSQNKPVFFPNPTASKATVFCKMDTRNRHLGIIPVDSVILEAFDCVELAQTTTCKDNASVYLNDVTCTYTGPLFDGLRFTVSGTTKITFNITDAHPTGDRIDKMAVLMFTNQPTASCKMGTGFLDDLTNREICSANSASVDGYKLQPGKLGEIIGYGSITTVNGLS